jgi:hypothetical protein
MQPLAAALSRQRPTQTRPRYSTAPFCGISVDAVRRHICILANFALLIAFLEAPFLHVHQHEATQRHQGGLLHFHLKTAHAFGSSALFQALDPDDDALVQNWVSASPNVPDFSPVILAEHFCLAEPEHTGCIVDAPLSTGPDPPLISTKSPRAPPV